MPYVRRAGRGRQADGTIVVWSVSDGSRGRRSREVRIAPDGGGIISSLLLETDSERRFSHIELSTRAGLLTLHPEADGTLHGNAIRDDGIEHITGLPWTADGMLLVDGSPLAEATAARLAARPGVSVATVSHVVVVDVELRCRVESRAVGPGDDAGFPRLANADAWPLELE